MASNSIYADSTPQQNKAIQTLIRIFGVPLARFLDATGLYTRLFQVMRGKIAAERVKNNFGTYQLTKQDIVVCTFPKSGTNWMLQIAYQIAHRGQGDFEGVHQYMPWPDALFSVDAKLEDETIAQRSPFGLRVNKTHLYGDYLPYTPDAKYICILRDPKDVFVSSYFFLQGVIFGAMMPSVATWYKTFVSDSFLLGSWTQNLHEYWQLRHHPNVMVLTFEQMKTDHMGIVRQVTDFLGVELTEAEIQLVYEKSTFDYMKNIAHKFDPPALTPMSSKQPKMLRKGQSGGSSELLTVEQQRYIDDYCRAQLQRLGCDFPYDEMFTVT